jgi:hypothetical protein
LFAKFVLSCSLRSHHKTNPTPKNGSRHYWALPTHHPEKNSKIEVERMKNKILTYTAEKKRISAWNATAYNERFGASGAVARLKGCANLQVLRPSERQ